MNEELYQEIIIDWHPIIPWEDSESDKINERNVLYQIYCDSHIYGRNVLAYIGKTDRRVKHRFSEHEKSFFKFANNVTYSIGTIENYSADLTIPESILIANHKPFFNQSYLHQICEGAKSSKIIIINKGNHGTLKNSCTNFWWVKRKEL